MSLSSDAKGVIAPVDGIMTISGQVRLSTIGSSVQGYGYLNGSPLGDTFFSASNAAADTYVLPTIKIKVRRGDVVGIGYGGFPSNIASVADQSTVYFQLDQQ